MTTNNGKFYAFLGSRSYGVFSLHDQSEAKVNEMVDACKKYLDDHPGVIYFSVGTLCQDLARPVNDRDHDVALHVVFADRAAHDAYQVAPRHNEFIALQKANWKNRPRLRRVLGLTVLLFRLTLSRRRKRRRQVSSRDKYAFG